LQSTVSESVCSKRSIIRTIHYTTWQPETGTPAGCMGIIGLDPSPSSQYEQQNNSAQLRYKNRA
jgi:hypothetical protein